MHGTGSGPHTPDGKMNGAGSGRPKRDGKMNGTGNNWLKRDGINERNGSDLEKLPSMAGPDRPSLLGQFTPKLNFGLNFSFWPEVNPREKRENGGSHIYELRRY